MKPDSPLGPRHQNADFDLELTLREIRERALRKIARALITMSDGQPGLMDDARVGDIIRAVSGSAGLTPDLLKKILDGEKHLTRHDAGQWFSRILAANQTVQARKASTGKPPAPNAQISALSQADFLVFANPDGADTKCVKPLVDTGQQKSAATALASLPRGHTEEVRHCPAHVPAPSAPTVSTTTDFVLGEKRQAFLQRWWEKRGSTNPFSFRRALEILAEKSRLPESVFIRMGAGEAHLTNEDLGRVLQVLPKEQTEGLDWRILLDPADNGASKQADTPLEAKLTRQEPTPEPNPPAPGPKADEERTAETVRPTAASATPGALAASPADTEVAKPTAVSSSPDEGASAEAHVAEAAEEPAGAEAAAPHAAPAPPSIAPPRKQVLRVQAARQTAAVDASAAPLSRSQHRKLSDARLNEAKKILSRAGAAVPDDRLTSIADALAELAGAARSFVRAVLSAHTSFGAEKLVEFKRTLEAKLAGASQDLNFRLFANPKTSDIGITLESDPGDATTSELATLKPRRLAEAKAIADAVAGTAHPLTAWKLAETLHVEDGLAVSTLTTIFSARAHISVLDLPKWRTGLLARCPALEALPIDWELFLEPGKARSLNRPLTDQDREKLAEWRLEVVSRVLRRLEKLPRAMSSRACAVAFAAACGLSESTTTVVLLGKVHYGAEVLGKIRAMLNALQTTLGDDPELRVLMNPTENDIGKSFDETPEDLLRRLPVQLVVERNPADPDTLLLKLALPEGFVVQNISPNAAGSDGTITLTVVQPK